MMSIREPQAAPCGERAPFVARPQEKRIGRSYSGRYGGDGAAIRRAGLFAIIEIGEELSQLRFEIVPLVCLFRTTKREGGARIGAGRTTDAEINARREERVEDAKELGHFERTMIGEHDSPRSYANRARGGGDLADHDLGGGARQTCRIMMLCQ